MPGRHRRPLGWTVVCRRVLTGLVAVCMSLSLFSISAVGKPREVNSAQPYRPETVTVVPAPPTAIVTIAPTTVEPTPEPTVPVETREPIPEPEPEPDPIPLYPSTGFGGVKPHVAYAGHLIADVFGLSLRNIGGVGQRARTSEHPKGLALDFMCDRATGDDIAAYVLDRAEELDVYYVIWRQRINYGSGWEPMEDRGGITANHYDHVHVSFNP